MKVQVIGLPGTGKTTGIKNYKNSPLVLDIRNFTGYNKELSFKKKIEQTQQDLIAESACGVNTNTYIIKLQIPEFDLLRNLQARKEELDYIYFSYLSDRLLPSNYTVSSSEDLTDLLKTLFEKNNARFKP